MNESFARKRLCRVAPRDHGRLLLLDHAKRQSREAGLGILERHPAASLAAELPRPEKLSQSAEEATAVRRKACLRILTVQHDECRQQIRVSCEGPQASIRGRPF